MNTKKSKLWVALVLACMLVCGAIGSVRDFSKENDVHVEVPISRHGPTTGFALQVSGGNQVVNVTARTVDLHFGADAWVAAKPL